MSRPFPRTLVRLAFAALALSAAGAPHAAEDGAVALQAEAVPELKFREFFRMPIGPRGLEISDRLAALQGKRVVITGYLARPDDGHAHGHAEGHAAHHGADGRRADGPPHGYAILSAFPITLGDADEHLVDDLPPNALFVHAPASARRALAWQPGPVRITGVLELGNRQEAGDRVSGVRLTIDSPAAVVPVVPRQAAAR